MSNKVMGIALSMTLLASIAGAVLKTGVAHGAPHTTIDNMNQRIRAWWVMTALLGVAPPEPGQPLARHIAKP